MGWGGWREEKDALGIFSLSCMRHLVQKGQGSHTDCVCRTLVWEPTRDRCRLFPSPTRPELGTGKNVNQIGENVFFFLFFP